VTYRTYDDQLAQCSSAMLQDAMDAMGIRRQCLDPRVRPLAPSMRAWGEAVTLYLEAVDKVPSAPFQMEMELIDELQPGQMVVAQCHATEMSAFWGGLLTNAALGRQAAGVVTDGGVRDYGEITSLGFPTFAAGLTPYDSLGRMDGKLRNTPITCGGVRVCPGDLVFADVDGVVVVPQGIAQEAIARAWEKARGESTVREELRAGASVVKTFRKYGIL